MWCLYLQVFRQHIHHQLFIQPCSSLSSHSSRSSRSTGSSRWCQRNVIRAGNNPAFDAATASPSLWRPWNKNSNFAILNLLKIFEFSNSFGCVLAVKCHCQITNDRSLEFNCFLLTALQCAACSFILTDCCIARFIACHSMRVFCYAFRVTSPYRTDGQTDAHTAGQHA